MRSWRRRRRGREGRVKTEGIKAEEKGVDGMIGEAGDER